MRSSVSRTEILALSILLIISSPLSASEIWRSNPLSQKLGKEDGLSGSGWELSISDTGEVLYFDGMVKEKKTFTDDGWITVRDGKSTDVTLDGEGRPIVIESGSEKTVNTYSESGMLVSTVTTVDGAIRSMRIYSRHHDGSPARTDSDGSIYIFSGDDFYYALSEEEGAVIRKVADDLYVRGDADGSALPEIGTGGEGVTMKVSDDESVTWNPSGTVSARTDALGTTRYHYDGDTLSREERTEGDTVRTTYYEGGIVVRRETVEDGELSSVITYAPDGSMKKDMYRKGKHYATVTYDRDGSTVLDVEML